MRKYIICFFVLACVAGASFGYYKGYGGRIVTRDEEKYIKDQDQAASAVQDTTKTTTQMIVETYDEVACKTTKEISKIPAAYLGLGRAELIDKLNEYMENMPLEEVEKGLIGYDLMYFSKDYIMLRKTYHPDEDFNKYYIKFTGGQVTVFYSDQKTVFEYTDIDLNDLPVEQKCEVISGKEVKDDKALYDFLENYSS
ncbi:MAG: hypothetical protein MRZ59_11540 [Clostridiales bacterium]|nr:hypothetical protein [Clostridiales bacterium]